MPYVQRDEFGAIIGVYRNRQPQAPVVGPDGEPLTGQALEAALATDITDGIELPDDDPDVLAYLAPREPAPSKVDALLDTLRRKGVLTAEDAAAVAASVAEVKL